MRKNISPLVVFICLLVSWLTGCVSTTNTKGQFSNTNSVSDSLHKHGDCAENCSETDNDGNAVENVASKEIKHRYKYKVRGKHYKVFASQEDFQEIGMASWYGPGFHGKKTANGERYNMYAMTAAHKTLPLGSWVQVTNLENGRKIKVRINDRGPFHGGRVIDLSKKAAQKLGAIKTGFIRVHIKAL